MKKPAPSPTAQKTRRPHHREGGAVPAADRVIGPGPDPQPASPLPDDENAIGSLSRDPSDPPADRGHQAPTFEGDDEEQVMEDLVERGVDEADTEQEQAARRRREQP